jgi:hypothetical protein
MIKEFDPSRFEELKTIKDQSGVKIIIGITAGMQKGPHDEEVPIRRRHFFISLPVDKLETFLLKNPDMKALEKDGVIHVATENVAHPSMGVALLASELKSSKITLSAMTWKEAHDFVKGPTHASAVTI